MNLQVLSNTVKEGRTNYTNDFEMKLFEPIDGLNQEAFFEVTSITYPSTTKNIADDECWAMLNFEYDHVVGFQEGAIDLKINKIIVEQGFYNLENLIQYLNNGFSEYDVVFTLNTNGKVKISVNVDIDFGNNHSTSKVEVRSGTVADGKPVIYIRTTLTFSKKLAFMLGFSDTVHKFNVGTGAYATNTARVSIHQIKTAEYLPDISDGLDKIFVYCEELERSLIGDTSSEILTTLPLQWDRQGKGNGELIEFRPVAVKRKFKKMRIPSLHIVLKDSVDVKIPFDSGTVSIEGLIHYA